METKNILTNLDINNLEMADTGYVKQVSTVNDGDALQITLSDDSVFSAGDLLPSPAKNLTNIAMEDNGNLTFEMDDGTVYDSGKLEIQITNDGEFPLGVGSLSTEGTLKELEAGEGASIEEKEDSFILSFDGSVIREPFKNTINTRQTRSYDYNVLADSSESGSSSLTLQGGELYVARGVELASGINKLTTTFLFNNVNMFAFIIKEAGTENVVSMKEYSMAPTSTSVGSVFRTELDTPEDILVDIMVRFDSPNLTYLDTQIGETGAKYYLTLCTVNILNIKIDATALVNFVPSLENDYTEYSDVNTLLDSFPSDYQTRDMMSFSSEDMYSDLYQYGDKIIAVSQHSRNITLFDTVTETSEDIFLPIEGFVRVSYFLQDKEELWFSTSSEPYLFTFNMVTRQLEKTKYRTISTFTSLLWDHENDVPTIIQAGINFYRYNEDGTYYSSGSTYVDGDFRYYGSYSKPEVSGALDVRRAYIGTTTDLTFTYKNNKISEDFSDFVAASDEENVYALSYIQVNPDPDAFRGYTSQSFIKEGLIARHVSNVAAINSGRVFFNPGGTVMTISANPKELNIAYELINYNDDILEITGFSFEGASPTSSNASKMELLTSTIKPLLSKDMTVINEDESFHLQSYFSSYVIQDNYSGTHGQAAQKYVTNGHPRVTIELKEPVEIKKVGISAIPGVLGSQNPNYFYFDLSDDGENWTRSEVDYGDNPIVSDEEKGIHIFDSPMTLKGLRVTMPGSGVRILSHFYPLIMVDGKIEIMPIEIASTESNNVVVSEDGTVVTANDLISASSSYGITRMFSRKDIVPSDYQSQLFAYFKNDSSKLKHFQYIFPEDKEIVGYICNGRTATETEGAILEHSVDGENWEKTEDIVHSTQTLPVYEFGLRTFVNRQEIPTDDLLFLKLKEPKKAKYIRIALASYRYTTMNLDRIRINPLEREEYDIQEIDLSSEDTFYDVDLPSVAEARQAKVKITERSQESTFYISKFKFKLLNSNKFRLTTLNRETENRTIKDFELSFESESDRKTFLSGVIYIKNTKMGLKDGNLQWLFIGNNLFCEVIDGVVKQSVPVNFINDSCRVLMGDVLYHISDEKILEKLTSDKKIVLENFNKPTLQITNSTYPFIEGNGYNPSSGEYFLIGSNYSQLYIYDYYTDLIRQLNIPVETTAGYTGMIPLEDGTCILFPNRDVELVAILPVGTIAKRDRAINPEDGSEGFYALPNTTHLVDDFVKVKHPLNESDVDATDLLLPRVLETITNYRYQPFYKKELQVDGEIEIIYEFKRSITFNAVDSGFGYSSTTAISYADNLKLYSSDDGLTWTLITSYELVNKKSSSKEPRNTFEKVTTKFIKYVASYEASGRNVVRCPWFTPITDEEDYTTDEYNRVVQYTEGHDYEELGQPSSNSYSKYYKWIKLDEFRYLIFTYGSLDTLPTLELDVRTKKMTPHLLGFKSNARIATSVKLPNGDNLIFTTDERVYKITKDLTLKETAFLPDGSFEESVLTKDATVYLANSSNGVRPFTLNIANLMNSAESYSGESYGQGTYRGMVANKDDVLVFSYRNKNSFISSSLQDFSNKSVLFDIPLNDEIGYVSRLPNGKIFIVPYNSPRKAINLTVLDSESLTGEYLPGYNEYFRLGG